MLARGVVRGGGAAKAFDRNQRSPNCRLMVALAPRDATISGLRGGFDGGPPTRDNFEMNHRLGVFATTEGWVVADWRQKRTYDTWLEAKAAALREASVARWRGAEVEIVAQDQPGGPLVVVEPAGQRA